MRLLVLFRKSFFGLFCKIPADPCRDPDGPAVTPVYCATLKIRGFFGFSVVFLRVRSLFGSVGPCFFAAFMERIEVRAWASGFSAGPGARGILAAVASGPWSNAAGLPVMFLVAELPGFWRPCFWRLAGASGLLAALALPGGPGSPVFCQTITFALCQLTPHSLGLYPLTEHIF
jgi:hypothetical protein